MKVQVRGWSASGKSRIFRQLITEHGGQVVAQPNMPEFIRVKKSGEREKIEVDIRRLDGNLYVLGNYDIPRETTGGADDVSGQVGVDIMRWYLPKVEHLIWESRNGSSDRPDGEWLDVLREFSVVWATLSTPPETCIDDIYRRRQRTGRGGGRDGTKPINRRSFDSGYNRVHNLVDDAAHAGVRCVTVPHPHEPAYLFVHDLLTAGGWTCSSQCSASVA